MLIDKQNQFSADTGDSPTGTGNNPSTNIIDLGVARDIGGATADNLMLLAQVTTAFTSGGSATLQVQYQGSNDASSWTTIAQTDVLALSALTAGTKFLAGELINPNTLYRYHRLNYLIGTASMTAGTIRAGFVPSLDVQASYPRGYAA